MDLEKEFNKKQKEWAEPFSPEEQPERYALVEKLMRDGKFYGEIIPPTPGTEKKKVLNILKITNYLENVEYFFELNPFFYDRSGIFWFWDKKKFKWKINDEVDVMNLIDDELEFGGETVTGGVKNNYLEAFKRVGRKNMPKEAPKRWIQFRDVAFSLRSSNIYPVQPNFFFCNPIPYKIGDSDETPTMDKLFKEWVGEKYVDTLYEIIAYCCYTDYPIQVLFCLHGIGRNGKTCFLRLLQNFLGKDNICSTDLDLLFGRNSNRFEGFKLYKKLSCFMGETNFGILNSSSLLKKLTGGDLIGFEKKNKDPFDAYNYAKILIASNSLPTSEDTSEGFYRRWIIIDFPNQFSEGRDILETIPKHEYENLSKKVIKILPKLLEQGRFTNQGSVKQRMEKYIMVSNPLLLFINEHCKEDSEGYLRYSEFYTKYAQYLKSNKRRVISKREFSQFLDMEGLEVRRTTKDEGNDRYIEGIRWKDMVMDFTKNDSNDSNDSYCN